MSDDTRATFERNQKIVPFLLSIIVTLICISLGCVFYIYDLTDMPPKETFDYKAVITELKKQNQETVDEANRLLNESNSREQSYVAAMCAVVYHHKGKYIIEKEDLDAVQGKTLISTVKDETATLTMK